MQVKVRMKGSDKKSYPVDLTRIGKILKEGGCQGFVVLEYEDEAPFTNIPKALDDLRAALEV